MKIINIHRVDITNIGDYYSAPLHYFSFPGSVVEHGEILDLNDLNLNKAHVIVGGGGLLDSWFKPFFDKVCHVDKLSLIAWGLGQQLDTGPWYKKHRQFNYGEYLSSFNLVGIRDYDYGFPWVPCASCMNISFDKPREIKHEFIVYSHKTRPVPIVDFPSMTNETNQFEEVLDFLGSGETILTSSYHGAYWGILLNRKVLAFPFNSKFFTFRHTPMLFPAVWKKNRSFLNFKKNKSYELETVKGWRILAGAARNYPQALDECRRANIDFHQLILKVIQRTNR